MSKELKSIKFPGLPDAYFVPETSGDDFSFDPTAYELPVLLLNGNSEGISKDNEVNLNYSLNDKSGSCTLKWQGSSSLAYEKKNYTIKFDNAFEAVEGWGEQNKYCLKANWIDHSHSRNIVSAKLWGEMVKSRTSLLGWNAEYDIYHDDAYSYANGVLTSLTNVVNDGGRFLADFILPEGGFNVTCDVYFPEGATDLTATLCMHRKDTNVSAFVQKSVSAAGKWETVTFSEIWTAGSASFISLQGQNTTGVKFRNIRVDGLYNLVGTTYHYSPVEQIKSLPNGGAVDGFPVVVMLNDEFHGLYTFNIPKDGWMFGLVEDTTKKQAVVGANNHTDATWFKSTAELDERDFELEFVSDGYNSDWVLYSLNTLINACISSDGSDLDTTVAQYLDWKSAIDYLIFIVLLDGSDMVSKNYLLTTLDGRKWFFTAYDMDSTYGLHWDASGLSDAVAGVSFSGCVYHRVFELIMNYKFEELKARYNELRQTILSEHNICEAFENFAWAIPSPVLMEDIKRHSTIKGSSVNDIDQICRWVQQRLEVVDKWVNGETISNGTKFVEVLYKNGVYSLVDATYESILADISQGIDVRLELNGGTWIKRYCLVLDYSMNSNVGNRYLLFAAGNSTTIDDLVIKPDNTVRRDTGKSVTDARTINGYKLNENITLTASDVGAYSKEEIDSKGYLTESDKQEIAEQAAELVNVTPETYGAVGDGVTDDAEAIAQALANSKHVTFDGTKTYAVGSSIVIPADSHVDFCGATLVPLGNHDVIRVKPGSFIENLVIRCTEVPGWDSSAIVFYGGDAFRASNPTRANNLKLYNDTNYNNGGYSVGNGIYLYLDEDGRYLEGINISNAMTSGFGYGIRMSDLTDAGEPIADHGFIGANTFSNYWSYRDKIGICIDSKSTHCITTNNFFTDLNIQSDYYNSSECAIYCRGDSNYFSGCLYDYVILDYHPTAAVYFDVGSTKNFVEVTAGMVNKAGFCVDLGANNKVVKKAFEDTIITPANRSVGFFGNQDDAFAYLDKRADCTLESLDVEPTTGDISCVFDPSPNKTLIYHKDPSTGLCRARITINLRRVLREMSHLILQFTHRRSPTTVKVTVYNATDAVVIYDVTNNAEREIRISPDIDEEFDAIPNIAKIVIELGGTYSFGGINPTYWEISRILAADKYGVGNTWLGRDGGEIYGNVKFGADNGIVLTDAEGKKYKLTVSTDGVLGTAEYIEEEEEAPEVAILVPTMAAGATWYNAELAGAEQNTITTVTFDSSYEPTGNEDASWACDDSGVGYIMAYRNGTEITIASTTGSDGVKLNKDSTYMFANNGTKANFASLSSITGTETWIADKDTDMTGLLQSNAVITEPVVIPEGVYVTNNMFMGCQSLLYPPVIPEGVVSMANMFANCSALKILPAIPSTVIKMHYAFHVCRSVTDVDITIPEKVFQINAAFRNCFNMNGTVTVNAANLTEYGACFENTCRDSGSVVLTGTNAQLAALAATNTLGKVTVA